MKRTKEAMHRHLNPLYLVIWIALAGLAWCNDRTVGIAPDFPAVTGQEGPR